MKLYVRYKKNGRWTWRPATAQDILEPAALEESGAELHSEGTRKLVEGDATDETEMS